MVNADRYVVQDDTETPTGELRGVGGTYYDLRVPRPLGKGIEKAPGQRGYNLTYCLTKGAPKKSITFAARLVHPDNGRYIEILTDHPGLFVNTCGHFPNPDQPPPPPPTKQGAALLKVFDTLFPQDDDGIDPEVAKKMDKVEWPRPASLPDQEYVVQEQEVAAELIPETDERCETPPPRDPEDLEDPDFNFPKDDIIEACVIDEEYSDMAQSIHEESGFFPWKPPEPIHGKSGAMYRNDCAIVFMPMEYPDSVKHREFPNPMLYPGDVYSRTVIYKMGVIPKRQESRAKLLEQLLVGDTAAFDEARSGSEN